MQKLTIPYKGDTLNTPNNVEEIPNSKSSKILDREQVNNTPFFIMHTEHGYCLVLGNHRLTEYYKTKKQARDYITNNQWELITQLILIIHGQLTKNPKTEPQPEA